MTHDPANSPAFVLHTRVMAGTGGGPEKTILRSPKYADPSRYRMAAAYLHPEGDPGIETLAAQARELGCELHTLGEAGPVDPRPLRALLDLCRRLNVTIWHGHDYKSNLYGLLLRPFWPMTLVSTAHLWTDDTLRMRLYRRVDEMCLPWYDQVIAVSSPLAKRCREIGVREDRLTMIPNAIEAAPWTRTRSTAEAKQSLGIPAETLTLGVTGRLNVQKRIDRLLRAVHAMRQRSSMTVSVLLVGDGPERGWLEALVDRLGLRGVVRFCGWQADARPWYEAMDLFALTSRDEGLPNAVLEAMAMSVPVAATDVGGVRDLLDDGACGVVLDPDESQWPATFACLLEDEAERARLAATARQRIESHFTFERRMQRVMAVYDRAVARTTQRRAA